MRATLQIIINITNLCDRVLLQVVARTDDYVRSRFVLRVQLLYLRKSRCAICICHQDALSARRQNSLFQSRFEGATRRIAPPLPRLCASTRTRILGLE